MEKIHLCSCKNCGSILIDTNPQSNAVEVELSTVIVMTLDTLTNFVEDGEDVPNGCPNCKTDSYLSDDYTDCLEWLDKQIKES